MDTARRCHIVAGAAQLIARSADELVRAAASPQRTDGAETIAAELIPLCDALRWLGRSGPAVLRARRLGPRGRPAWLWGVRSTVHRVPRGTVLVVGAWNYPMLLGGVQVAQALAAGNRVLWKPAPGCVGLSQRLAMLLEQSGIPSGALRVLDSDPKSAIDAMDRGVDLVVLTGSVATGRAVLAHAAAKLTPAIVELSGCDCLIAMAGADLRRVTEAIVFGISLSSGATCIAPRCVLVDDEISQPLLECLRDRVDDLAPMIVHPSARSNVVAAIDEAMAAGARELVARFDREACLSRGHMHPAILVGVDPSMRIMRSDLFGPVASVCRVNDIRQAVQIVNGSPYRLAASIFGPRAAAERMAAELDVGVVTVNDLIMPTADPRLPFGGRGSSGFGVTRGPEGLLEMTVPKVTCVRRGGPRPHLMSSHPADLDILAGALQMRHAGSLRQRLGGLRRLVRAVRLRRTVG